MKYITGQHHRDAKFVWCVFEKKEGEIRSAYES